MRELYIDKGSSQSRIILLEDGNLKDIYIENHDNKSIAGNIYKGRIENIVPGLNAVFVNIGLEQNAIMHVDEKALKNYKRGQDIIVQVIRETKDNKGPRVASKITIPGKFMVIIPDENIIHFSKKISSEEKRKNLSEIFNSIADEYKGIIVRTEALEASKEEIQNEYNYLKEISNEILYASSYKMAPKLLFNAKDFYEYIIREYIKSDVDNIYINTNEGMNYIKKKLEKINPIQSSKLVYYEHDFRYLNTINSKINDVLKHRIELKSGGYILIDCTDAFTCIDVNTGKFTGDSDLEETAMRTNLEACYEVYNLVRLRNMSGIILIDFINMSKRDNEVKIVKTMEEMFSRDKVHTTIYGFTKLGILEMSRAKKGKGLEELIFEDKTQKKYNCAYLLKEIENQCIKGNKYYNITYFKIFVSLRLKRYIDTFFPNFTELMKKAYNITIVFIQSNSIDNFYFYKDKEKFINIDMGEFKINGKLIEIKEDEDEIVVRMKRNDMNRY